MQKENQTDMVNIFTSLKNKYSIVPCAVAVQGEPVANTLTARYLMDTLLLDRPSLASVLVVPTAGNSN
jgi:hypothetical protein